MTKRLTGMAVVLSAAVIFACGGNTSGGSSLNPGTPATTNGTPTDPGGGGSSGGGTTGTSGGGTTDPGSGGTTDGGAGSDPTGGGTTDGGTADPGGGTTGGGGATDGGSSTGGTGSSGAWLTTSGNHILLPSGARWHGRGANMPDFRNCGASLGEAPDLAEWERRVDALVDGWHANLVRLDLESYSNVAGGQDGTVLADPVYRVAVEQLVRYIESKNAYVLLSLWIDPTFTKLGWPTADTQQEWKLLATDLAHDDRVLFGLVNEPQSNFDGAQDAQVWTAMNDTVAAIRDAEAAAGGGSHVITVQGTRDWARDATYYVKHPITAGGGKNVAYEIHIYDPQSNFDSLLGPASSLPMIVGEFGPSSDQSPPMSIPDTQALMSRLQSIEVPYIAWVFHMRCSPDLLQDLSGGGSGKGMPLRPTAWGTALMDVLAQPW